VSPYSLKTTFLRCGAVASLLICAAAPSPTPSALPSGTPNPLSSFSAAGWLSLKAVAREKVATIKAEIQLAHNGSLTRIDFENVSLSANNGRGEVTQPIPQSTLSGVIDQAKGTFMVWSSRRPVYYESRLNLSRWNVSTAFGAASALTSYQVLSFSLNLLGRQMVNGHMSSVFELDSKVQRQGGKVQNTVGHVAFADDLSGLPIHEDVTIGAGEPSTVTVQADLTRISTNPPLSSEFAAPAGYTKTTQLAVVLMALAPAPPPKRKP
jgi:hypothetical protein